MTQRRHRDPGDRFGAFRKGEYAGQSPHHKPLTKRERELVAKAKKRDAKDRLHFLLTVHANAVGDKCSPTCGCHAARKKWPGAGR